MSNRGAELLLAAFPLPCCRTRPWAMNLLVESRRRGPLEVHEEAVNPTHLSDATQDKNSPLDTSVTGQISREKTGTADCLPYFT